MSIFGDVSLAFYIFLTVLIHAVVFVHILLNKHDEPASAVLWLIVVIVFPFVGIILYLMFGVNRIKTIGVKIRLADELVNNETDRMLHAGLKNHQAVQKEFIFHEANINMPYLDFNRTIDRMLADMPPLQGNKVELLKDGTMAYPRMFQAIEQAESSIHLQSFIIMGDEIGRQIFDALEKKARSGINVRILYDKFGSTKATWAHFFKIYLKKKIPNFSLLPFARANIMAPWRVQLRNHRKLLVVDGKTAFIGGINISSENVKQKEAQKDKYIHDLHCKIDGPAVGELQFSFLRDWCYATNLPPSKVFREECFPLLEKAGDCVVRVIDTGPGQNDEASSKVFFTAASTARKYIWIMTPYFVPDKPFIQSLCMACARGVEVRLIIPRNNNHWYVDYATHSLYENLMKNGVRIFEKKGVFSHVKAMIVDGEWCMMGSSNCDVRSFRLNYELDFVVSRGDFPVELKRQFNEELEESEEVHFSSVASKRLPRRLAENLCSLLTPTL